MIKNIITFKNPDYSIFIQCDCGREILNFYYYKETFTCEEIICLDYFGYVKNEDDFKSKYFTFDHLVLNNFINDLISAQNTSEEYYKEYEGKNSYLTLKKDNFNFYHLYRFKDKNNLLKNKYIWDVTFHQQQISELIEELLNMKMVIEQNQRKGYSRNVKR